MPEKDIYTKARKILAHLQIPRNESERYKRDWAKAVVDRDEPLAIKVWADYCHYIHRCGIAE